MQTPVSPGSAESARIREELPKLSRRMRTAFAAGSAERVLPIVEDYFGKQEDCRQALDLAWRYALGEDIPEAELREAHEACDALIDRLYEADELGSTMYAVRAIANALESTFTAESEIAEEAASSASDAAQTRDAVHGDEHIQEESDWQMLALDVARNAATPSRDMFRALPAPPRWLESFYRERAVRPPVRS